MPRAGRRPATLEEARAVAHPVRLRIIRETGKAELTNAQLAQRLGRDPATTLHHVRTLVAAGFLVAGEARRGPRGAREIPYRSTGKSWYLDLEDAPPRSEIGSAMLEAYLEEVRTDPRPDHTRLALSLSAADQVELDERLMAVLDDFAARAPALDGQEVAVFLSVYRPGTQADRGPRPRGT